MKNKQKKDVQKPAKKLCATSSVLGAFKS
ncbi:hypothetical protein PPL_01784 [Heterostelium album PN500]|uniref:Uncharacterized protein n=1 Tax=Heterostelium pallidum (strain ATCC 26659 / Pp 5 / PN500) TaxID=670386 RepID=D3B0G7_HETP5|nr:hypothetical protein PPL_01784 [Heterostelium album PN500]